MLKEASDQIGNAHDFIHWLAQSDICENQTKWEMELQSPEQTEAAAWNERKG